MLQLLVDSIVRPKKQLKVTIDTKMRLKSNYKPAIVEVAGVHQGWPRFSPLVHLRDSTRNVITSVEYLARKFRAP